METIEKSIESRECPLRTVCNPVDPVRGISTLHERRQKVAQLDDQRLHLGSRRSGQKHKRVGQLGSRIRFLTSSSLAAKRWRLAATLERYTLVL